MYVFAIGVKCMKNKSSAHCRNKLDVAWIVASLSVTKVALSET
jgi:hypothetical protein